MRIDRLFIASCLASAALSLSASAALAQTPAAEPASESRAARDAENPLRVILEAGKLKTRIKPDGKPDKEPHDTAAPSDRSAVRTLVPVAAPRPAAAASTAAGGQDAVKAAAAALQPSQAFAAPAVVAPIGRVAAPVEPAPLKQIKFVEPQLGLWARLRSRSDAEVAVVFTVNTDGSVSNIFVRSNPDKVLDPIVVDAVRQWRFEPIPQPRDHSVVLAVRASDG